MAPSGVGDLPGVRPIGDARPRASTPARTSVPALLLERSLGLVLLGLSACAPATTSPGFGVAVVRIPAPALPALCSSSASATWRWVFFSSLACPYCRAERTELAAAAAQWHARQVEVVELVVDVGQCEELPASRESSPWPTGVADLATQQAWGVTQVPSMFVVQQGVARAVVVGQAPVASLLRLQDELMADPSTTYHEPLASDALTSLVEHDDGSRHAQALSPR